MKNQERGMKLLITIVERGQGSEISKLYSDNQVFWHYQCAGRGTASSELLDVLGFGTSERDILLSTGTDTAVERLLYELNNDLRAVVGAKGIACSMPLTAINNLLATLIFEQQKEGEEERMSTEKGGSYSMILVAVNQGHTDEVMDTANRAGARGGSIIRARWADAGVHEKFYGISVQKEKEIIALVVPAGSRNKIMESINREHGMTTEAKAMICSVGLESVVRLG